MRKVAPPKSSEDILSKGSEPVCPMPEPIEIPAGLARLGKPDSMWIYRRSDGAAFGAVARWDGGEKKEIRPIIWNGTAFVSSGLGENRPLLNADLVSSQPLAPILIVEGEKTLDGATQYVPEGWIVVTWSGGSGAWNKTDWSVLAGHTCVIWPDNDEPGLKVASHIQVELTKFKIPTSLVTLSSRFPVGWDLADPLPVGNADTITEILRRKLRDVELLQLEIEPEQEDDKVEQEEDHNFLYRVCGFNNATYYIMPQDNRQVHEYTMSKLGTKEALLEIVTDIDYWRNQFPGPKGSIDTVSAMTYLKNQCTAVGRYSSDTIRHRGVWRDDGRVILNTGESLFVDGRQVHPVKFRSKFIYPIGDRMLDEAIDLNHSASDQYGRLIRDACSKARWTNPIYADLFAGWIATAVVCGGLDWRTHIWITGNHGCGKSTLIKEIATKVLGKMAIYPVGKSTEAGIRQHMVNNSIPVVFDESEDDRSGEQRSAIIQLMRQSSSDTEGTIMKGSANHQSVSFSLRSSFLLSSIGVGLREAADLSRTAVLTLKPFDAKTNAERAQEQEERIAFIKACYAIPKDVSQKLLARQVHNLDNLRSNIEVFKEVISLTVGNPRLGDQLGTLLAGNYSLISTNKIDHKLCEKYVEGYDWSEFTSVKSQREDLSLIYHLMTSIIKVETGAGSFKERGIGELIDIAMGYTMDDRVTADDAKRSLLRSGIRIDVPKDGVWIATKLKALETIMAKSDFSEGWLKVLERHPLVERSTNALKFSGASSRAIFFPREELNKVEG